MGLTEPQHWQFYWDCDDWVDNFYHRPGFSWADFNPHYREKVDAAVAWLKEHEIDFQHDYAFPFFFVFYNRDDVMQFKLRWGSGKILEHFHDGTYRVIGRGQDRA